MLDAIEIGKRHERGDSVVDALGEVSLGVEAGEFVAVCGPSGSGKTTLLSLLGLLDVPTTGQVRVEGVDAGTLDEDERAALRRRRIGFVFQFFNLLPALNARENVAVPAMLDGRAARSTSARVEELLDSVGLQERGSHRPEQLSGGEQQRVAIARALVADPAVVLADEPTGNLDSTTGRVVLETLIAATSALGRSLVVVTHDRDVAGLADRTVELRDGRPAPSDAVEAGP